jgi:hypothetical protein
VANSAALIKNHTRTAAEAVTPIAVIMDDIKLNPRLTANVGLRWGIMVPFTAVGNNVAFLNPNAVNSYVGATSEGSQLSLVIPHIDQYDRAAIH